MQLCETSSKTSSNKIQCFFATFKIYSLQKYVEEVAISVFSFCYSKTCFAIIRVLDKKTRSTLWFPVHDGVSPLAFSKSGMNLPSQVNSHFCDDGERFFFKYHVAPEALAVLGIPSKGLFFFFSFLHHHILSLHNDFFV